MSKAEMISALKDDLEVLHEKEELKNDCIRLTMDMDENIHLDRAKTILEAYSADEKKDGKTDKYLLLTMNLLCDMLQAKNWNIEDSMNVYYFTRGCRDARRKAVSL